MDIVEPLNFKGTISFSTVPPTFLEPPTNKVVSTEDTQSVNFTCKVQAYPRPTITWYREIEEGQERLITSGETERYMISETNSMLDGLYAVRSILAISDLRSQDSRRIRCVATISVQGDTQPPPEGRAAYLSVLGK